MAIRPLCSRAELMGRWRSSRWGSLCTPAGGDRPGWARKAAPFLAAVLLAVSFLSFYPAPPDNDVDSSLSGVLSYAHQHAIQFGPEFVFTYGPLGYLMLFYYSPHAAGLRIVVDVALCLVTATGLCLMAWRLRPLARWLLLILFFWIAPNVSMRADLVFYVGLLCWGLLCFVESGRRLPVYGLVFMLLATFNALAKVSFLFVALASVALVACDVAVRGRWRLALGMIGGFAACFVLGWLGSGQELAHIGAFLANGLAIVNAYNGALGWEGPALLRTMDLILAPVVLAMILLRTLPAFGSHEPRRAARRVLLSAWLLWLSLAVWKYGCVRTGREVFFLGFVAVLAFVLEALPCERRLVRRWARGLALGVLVLALVTMQSFAFLSWPKSLGQPFREFARNLVWLLHPADYLRQVGEAFEANRREAQLPRCRELIGAASVDVFGHWQAYALHNDLNYHPRPVFQSYVACSRPLMQLNEQFYLSKSAPEYVLFRLFARSTRNSHRWKTRRCLRALLANYAPLITEARFVLLKRTATHHHSFRWPAMETVPLGQAIDLREFGDTDLWLEIALEPSWLGRLRQVLYRPPTVRLAAWSEPGGKLIVRKRAPAPDAGSGVPGQPGPAPQQRGCPEALYQPDCPAAGRLVRGSCCQEKNVTGRRGLATGSTRSRAGWVAACRRTWPRSCSSPRPSTRRRSRVRLTSNRRRRWRRHAGDASVCSISAIQVAPVRTAAWGMGGESHLRVVSSGAGR